jgi:hypothetical protein
LLAAPQTSGQECPLHTNNLPTAVPKRSQPEIQKHSAILFSSAMVI